MFFRISSILFAICIFGYSCKQAKIESTPIQASEVEYPETNHPAFVSKMEVAHQKGKLMKHDMICFNLDMTFGKRNSKMKIFTTPTSSAIRMDKKEGASTVMIDGDLYTDADTSKWKSEQFGIYTYQYFFMAPFKFSDEGTVWERMSDVELNGKVLNRAKLTFESGVGDAPDDWYIVHSDPANDRVELIGYIVTGGGRSIEEAEKNARAIKYSDYKMIDGIPIASKWEFFNYDPDSGIEDKVGEGNLKNIELMDVVDQFDIIRDGTYTKMSF